MSNGVGHAILCLWLFLIPILRFVTLSQMWNGEAKHITVFQIPLLGPKIKYCKRFAQCFV